MSNRLVRPVLRRGVGTASIGLHRDGRDDLRRRSRKGVLNAGGTQVLRFSTMRGLVAEVEVLLADGSMHDGLAALKKDNRGSDLTQLLIGVEGMLRSSRYSR